MGQAEIVKERLKNGIADLELTRRAYRFHYPFPPHDVVDYYRQYFGPIKLAFAALDVPTGTGLHRELGRLWTRRNLADNGETTVDAELLEVIAVRE